MGRETFDWTVDPEEFARRARNCGVDEDTFIRVAATSFALTLRLVRHEQRDRIIALALELAGAPPSEFELAMRNHGDPAAGEKWKRQVVDPFVNKDRS